MPKDRKPTPDPQGYTPPSSPEAEQSVLGAILVRPQVLDEIVDLLDPEDFYRHAHAEIYAAMLDLYHAQEPVDLVTVNAYLKDRYKLEGVGGPAFLAGLSEAVGFVTNALYYAKLVRQKAMLRRLLDASQEIASACLAPVDDVEEFIDEAENKIFLINERREDQAVYTLDDLVDKEIKRIEDIYQRKLESLGISSGFTDLDRMTNGWQNSDLIILAARPSMGKTALALNMAYHAGKVGVPTAFFSLEQPKEQLIQRLLSSVGHINASSLRSARMAGEDWAKMQVAGGELIDLPIHIIDKPAMTSQEVRSQARRLKSREGIGLLIVDYLQLMRDPKARSREQEVGGISRGLKALAKELNIPVIALCQLNREVEKRPNKRPVLSDLRECLPVDEWVDTPGGPVQLKTRPKQIITADQNGTKVAECLFIEKRYNRTYRVVTNFGAFSATARHLVLTGVGWKPIRDIVPGRDVIACPKRIPHENRGYLPHGRLLGWLIGNGYLSGTPCLIYRNELDTAVRSAVAAFGVTVRPRREQHSGNVTEAFLSNRVESGCLANPLMSWIRTLGLEGKTAKDKAIPWQYLGANDQTHKELLRGLWEADGTVTGGKAKYATCNELLARQVKWLLHTIGVRSTINHYENGHAGMWETYCAKEDNLRMQEICAEQQRFGELSVPSPRYIDPAPAIFVELAIELYGGEQRIQRRLDGAVKQVSKARMANMLMECPITTISESPYMTMEGMGWARVVAIEPQDADVCVCDLHVPETHSFLASGLVMHNSGSIEQDADVVMFIFRDQLYNEDSKEKGVAEIRIAKHRNGPVGRINLYFFEEYMRFGNYIEDKNAY
jgi:replicative DNA helicase